MVGSTYLNLLLHLKIPDSCSLWGMLSSSLCTSECQTFFHALFSFRFDPALREPQALVMQGRGAALATLRERAAGILAAMEPCAVSRRRAAEEGSPHWEKPPPGAERRPRLRSVHLGKCGKEGIPAEQLGGGWWSPRTPL